MPTSSIFTNIVINDPEKVEKFIDALEASSHDPAWQAASPIKQPLTDIEKIRELMAKRNSSKDFARSAMSLMALRIFSLLVSNFVFMGAIPSAIISMLAISRFSCPLRWA